MKKIISLSAAIFICISSFILPSQAQWSNDPGQNTNVCDTSGEQALPKISNTMDGGCYISWFDSRNGNYAVYLQRLNAMGEKQFPESGLLVSAFPQNSSLVDYDMITDFYDNAIIVFTDIRAGGEINPFAYRISQSGVFLWGDSGVALSTSPDVFQANPKVVMTNDGNFIFTWIYASTPNKLALQKLSADGIKQWGNDPIYLSGAGNENLTYPSMVASDSGSIIALWSGYSGSFLNPQNYRLYSQKISAGGTQVWSNVPDTVYGLGRVQGFYRPQIFSDGNNGALYVWHDDRNQTSLSTGHIQHFSSSGVLQFPKNGSPVSTLSEDNHFDPQATFMPSTGETFVFWTETNSLQSLFGIYGQKFSANGVQQWGEFGKELVPMNQNSYAYVSVFAHDTSVIVAYNEILFGSNNDIVKSLRVNRNGAFEWQDSILTVSNVSSEKIHLETTFDDFGMLKLAWEDTRGGDAGMYAQNVNWDGTLGVITSVQFNGNSIAKQYVVMQNYPNPFNPLTAIRYSLFTNSIVSLKVYDELGKEVATLINNEPINAGYHTVEFDGTHLSSGLYFYRMMLQPEKGLPVSSVRKMMLVK